MSWASAGQIYRHYKDNLYMILAIAEVLARKLTAMNERMIATARQ